MANLDTIARLRAPGASAVARYNAAVQDRARCARELAALAPGDPREGVVRRALKRAQHQVRLWEVRLRARGARAPTTKEILRAATAPSRGYHTTLQYRRLRLRALERRARAAGDALALERVEEALEALSSEPGPCMRGGCGVSRCPCGG